MALLSKGKTASWTSLGARAPRQNQQVFLLQSQNKHLSSVSNAGKARILGILALPRSLCVINAAEILYHDPAHHGVGSTTFEMIPSDSILSTPA